MIRLMPEWLRALVDPGAAAPGLEAAMPYLLGALGLGYLLGTIPFGILIAKAMGLGDPRRAGSGNIGATNLLRTGGRAAGAATLLLDAGKGLAAVWIAWGWGPDPSVLAAAGAVLGHLFPVWLAFRGGKGVATMLGATLTLAWPAGLAALAVWIAAAGLTRYSSVGGLAAVASAPVGLWVFGRPEAVLVFVALAALVWAKHAANIGRLIRGEESRIGGGRA
ncbi:MAG: glycerol-3-phosphate 1-O-acyltransferase PlsY [Pseudomonadota bacterium]